MSRHSGDTKGRILVVDDDATNRDLLSRRLERSGYSVEMAEGGRRALERVESGSYDLVMLDIMMPDLDGLEVLSRLRERYAPGDLPVIMATAKTESQDVVEALQLGANDYVTKPIDFKVALARVRSQLLLKHSRDDLRAAHARMRRDLQAAARVQQSLLPSELPQVRGARFAWHYEPCDELAGDHLDVIALGGDRAALYVMDVCGHGVRSSLLAVAMSHTLSRRSDPASIITSPGERGASDAAEPSSVAQRLSELFPMEDNDMLYATLAYGIVDGPARRFTFTCAGCPGPLAVRADGAVEALEEPGLPIGMSFGEASADLAYADAVVEVAPGDRLFLYSDGLTEEVNPDGEAFGVERLSAALAETRTLPLDESLGAVVERVHAWVGGPDCRDDLSIVAVEITA